jgi:hypothetical protein
MTKITFKNDYHSTEINLHVKGDTLTRSQMRRVNKELCGMSDCCCGDIRGHHDFEYEPTQAKDIDGWYDTLKIGRINTGDYWTDNAWMTQ